MRKALSLFAALLIAAISLKAQLPYVQSFESVTGYSSSSPFQIDVFNNDFFWRGIESEFNWQGTADLLGEDGSHYIGVEDHDFIAPGEQWIKTNPINIYGFNALVVDLSLASPNPSILRFEKEDSVVVEYRIDGGPWIKIDHFGGADSIVVVDTTETGDPATIILGSVFYRDGALDGIGVDANDVPVMADLTDYNYDLDALNGSGVTGCFLELRVRFSLEGPQEEVAVDHIRVNGTVAFTPSITTIAAGTQSACDPNTNTYSQDLVVTYSSDPGTGTLDVNGQSFSITGSPQTVTLTGLTADGLPVDVTAAFSDDGGCGITALGAFIAPADCSPACAVTAISAGVQSACNEITNSYSQEIIVTYENEPGNGSLIVNGQGFPITGSPQSCLLINLPADGLAVNVQASFSDDPGCNLAEVALFTAPASCASGCAGLGSAIHVEDFEDPNYTGYSTSSPFAYSSDSNDLFIRGKHEDFNWKSVVSGIGDTAYIGLEDHDFLGAGEQWLELDPVNVTDYKGIRLQFKLVAPANTITTARYEPDDYLIVEFDLDNSGSYTKIGEFRGFIPGGGQLFQDIGFDGFADAAVPNETAATYDLSLDQITGSPVLGSSIKVRFRFSIEGAHEELAFDDITVTGITGAGPAMPVASSDTICPGTSVLLSVTGEINDASGWKWYTGDCGDVQVGTGNSITFSPSATTTYYVRGEGDCVDPGPCDSITIVVGDFELPEISCPLNITVNTDPGICHAAVFYSAPVGTDNCSGATTLQTAGQASGFNFAVGTTTNTFEITDVAGQTASCSFTITVIDNVAAIASCQDITVQLDAGGTGTTTAGAVDNGSNDACGIASTVLSQTTFDCSEVGGNPEVLTVTDVNGNVSTCNTTVTIEDNVAPIAICQDVTVQLDAAGVGNTTAGDVNNNSSDACGIGSLSLDVSNFSCSNVGANTITLTVTDVNGNTNTCSSTATIEDNVAPAVVCQDITVALDASGNYSLSVSEIDGGTTDACGVASLVVSPSAFTCVNVASNTVTLTATDVNGNVSNCAATVTVEDNLAPTAICNNLSVSLDENGEASVTAEALGSGSFDACGIASLSVSSSTFDCSNAGNNTVTVTATDVNGNASTCSAIVFIFDDITPTLACPPNISVNTDPGVCEAEIDGSLTAPLEAFDNCDATLEYFLTGNPYALFSAYAGSGTGPVGTVSIIGGSADIDYTLTDASGNSATCSFTITVDDNEPPVVTCPDDVTVNTDPGQCSAMVLYEVGLSENCPIFNFPPVNAPELIFGLPSGSPFPLGPTLNAYTFTDPQGNSDDCSFTITVEDNEPPVAICQDLTIQLNAAGTVSIIPSDIDNGSFDACGAVELEINDVGFIEYDCDDVGVNPTTMAVIDESDNVAICDVNITVQDNVAPNAVCQDVTVQLDVNGNGSITTDDINNSSTDACGIANLSLDRTSFSCSDVGNNSVILTVTDVNTNSSTCGATVAVQDNVSPVAECNDVTVTLSAGNASITEAQVDNGSSDACGVASLLLDNTSFVCADVGDNTVVLTATDVNGNVSTCSAEITVEGIIPTVTITEAELNDFCQGGTLVLTANASVPVSYSWSTTEATESIEVSADGIYSVVVTSATGCTASASYTISGFDETALLSSYTILATGGDVSLEKFSAVNSGGVGVIPADKKAKLKDNSQVAGFVKAAQIDIDAGSTIGNPILAPATVPLPPFIANPTVSSNDVTVLSGTSVILGDNVYGKIDIKKDASVTFTSDNIFIDEIKLKEGSTISFNDCANLYINRKLDMGKTMTFNPTGEQVVIYIDNSVDVGLGSTVNARIFATGEISAKGKDSGPINMRGLFIADKLGSKDNVTWNWDLLCAPCPTSLPLTRIIPGALSQDEKFNSLKAEVYPNPFMKSVTIRFDLPETKHVSLDIINIDGTTVATLFEGQLDGGSSYSFDFDASDLAEGAYVYRIVAENEQITGKMILLK